MSEESGIMIVKSNCDINEVFTKNFNSALKLLAEFGGLDNQQLENSYGLIDEVKIKAGFVILKYDCSEWVDASLYFVKNATNIEYYSRHADDYGTLTFMALSSNGERIAFQYDEDEMEEEEHQEWVSAQLDHWTSLIPKEIIQYLN